MGGQHLLLFLTLLLGSSLFRLAGEALLQLTQGLHQRLRVLAHTRCLIQNLGGICSQFLGCILFVHFRHSTLAPPQ